VADTIALKTSALDASELTLVETTLVHTLKLKNSIQARIDSGENILSEDLIPSALSWGNKPRNTTIVVSPPRATQSLARMKLHRIVGAPGCLPLYLHVIPNKEVKRFSTRITDPEVRYVRDWVANRMKATDTIRSQARHADEEAQARLHSHQCSPATRDILSSLELWKKVPLGTPTRPNFAPLIEAKRLFEPYTNAVSLAMYLAIQVDKNRYTRDQLRRQVFEADRELLASLLAVDCQRKAVLRDEVDIVHLDLPVDCHVPYTSHASRVSSDTKGESRKARTRSQSWAKKEATTTTSHRTRSRTPCRTKKGKEIKEEAIRNAPPTQEEVEAWYHIGEPTCYACGSTTHTNWLRCPSRKQYFSDWKPNMYFLYL
jgi:hypothetical protein